MSRDRGSSQGAEEGDSYLASVSDLMAGLLFFFLITLSVFALRLERTRAEQQEKVDQWKGMGETREKILNLLKNRLAELGMKVEVDPEQGILRLSDEGILFPSGRATPAEGYLPNVGKIAAVLMNVLPRYVDRLAPFGIEARSRPGYCLVVPADEIRPCEGSGPADGQWLIETLLIEGHTDSVPIGRSRREFEDNLSLSAARAAEVLRMIRACEPGIDALYNAADQRIASVSGYAETRPVNAENTEADENRRIDLRFMMEPPRGLLDGGDVVLHEPRPARDVREVVEQ